MYSSMGLLRRGGLGFHHPLLLTGRLLLRSEPVLLPVRPESHTTIVVFRDTPRLPKPHNSSAQPCPGARTDWPQTHPVQSVTAARGQGAREHGVRPGLCGAVPSQLCAGLAGVWGPRLQRLVQALLQPWIRVRPQTRLLQPVQATQQGGAVSLARRRRHRVWCAAPAC